MCYFELKNPTDAYEVSFVAIPAQPKAGTTKNYILDNENINQVVTEESDIKEKAKSNNAEIEKNNLDKQDLISLRMKMIKSFIFTQKNLNEKEGM